MPFSPEAAFEFLQRAREGGRLAHAYLITGDAGSGKRALALRLALLVSGANPATAKDPLKHPDVHAVEPESKSRLIKVEQTRELEKELQMRSSLGGVKVGIIFDADRMNAPASNSFLKTLEEPPANSLLLLITAHPEMLLDTIISRCIQVSLASAPRREPTGSQRRLLDLLSRFFERPNPGLGDVFTLVREFTVMLSESKAAIQDEGAAELKREHVLYQQTTDSAKWLEDREEYFKALAEAQYLQVRAVFVDTLLQWWGDVLRQQHGAVNLDFPAYAAQTSALSRRMGTSEALSRLSALETLRENFNRNVQEQLAVEVAFLKAFGSSSAGGAA